MNCLNQIIVEGNIVREPELKSLPSGAASCTLPIAVNRKYKTGDGSYEEDVSYFDVDTFGGLAEVCVKWCPKGRGIRVVGRLKQNRWKDDAGKSHSRVKIIAEHIEFKPFLKKNPDGSIAQQNGKDDSPKSADLETTPTSKKKKLAMLAEAAAAAQHEQEANDIPVF
ncbi:MAG: single-stranded DNA-binding protein [Treponema sp.]|nr:single-stranded DNA-binding protein [Treponema sp.]MBR4386143.1 single-stranded DNA-binding protein [Treponema sp.]